MLPSAPSAMMRGELSSVGTSNSTRPVPSGFMRPMRLPLLCVNQTVPSGASAIVVGPLAGCGSANSVTWPVAVSRSSGAKPTLLRGSATGDHQRSPRSRVLLACQVLDGDEQWYRVSSSGGGCG